jgi:hypothetical protein
MMPVFNAMSVLSYLTSSKSIFVLFFALHVCVHKCHLEHVQIRNLKTSVYSWVVGNPKGQPN